MGTLENLRHGLSVHDLFDRVERLARKETEKRQTFAIFSVGALGIVAVCFALLCRIKTKRGG